MDILFQKGEYSGEVESLSSFPGVVLGKTKYIENKTSSGLHYHENLHLSLQIEGTILEKRKNGEYIRKPGDLMVCHAGEHHDFCTQSLSKNINIEFERTFFIKYDISPAMIQRNVLENPLAKNGILKAYFESTYNDRFSQTSLDIILLNLVTPDDKILRQKPFWARIVEDVLKERWKEKISLDELAVLTNVHPVTISKNFSRYLGCSFGEYRRSLRVMKGINLLKNSSLSASEIAFDCGFSDQSHFIRDLRKTTGFTPNLYKKL